MDCISFCRFCGLELMDSVPDHSTLSRFRSELTRKKLYQPIMLMVNKQLAEKGLMVKGTAIVDASLTLSPFSPKGKLDHQMAEDRKEDTRSDTEVMEEEKYHQKKEEESPNADHEARWLKKRKKTYFGYKRHIATNDDGLILGVHTTPANEHDSQGLGDLMEKVPEDERTEVMGDKGYKSNKNDQLLEEMGSKSLIMEKGYRHKPLTKEQKKRNKEISKKRWRVEQTFGGLHRWFGCHITRLKGLEKVHHQHILEAIAYNLKRSPGLVHLLVK